MKISMDGKEVIYLTDTQKKVIMNDIHADQLEKDIKSRIQYVIMHKYDQCFERLRDEWIPRLSQEKVKSIPLDEEEFAKLVFAHPSYLDRKARQGKSYGKDIASKAS